MGFRALRVLNEDRIAPGKGFGPHSHRDMEILTYMVDGRLAHRDSLTGPHVLGRNELQAMTAGDGIVHSEFNASDTEPSHSLQIWIEPRAEDLTPSYQQIAFAPEDKRGRLHLLAGPEAADPARTAVINQDARVYVTEVGTGRPRHPRAAGRTTRMDSGGPRHHRRQWHLAAAGRRRRHQRRAHPSSSRATARSCSSISPENGHGPTRRRRRVLLAVRHHRNASHMPPQSAPSTRARSRGCAGSRMMAARSRRTAPIRCAGCRRSMCRRPRRTSPGRRP